MNTKPPCRIVLTGGPGAGKTTAAALLRREIGDKVVIVPEAATILFSGGFPRHASNQAIRATQRAIYSVQKNLEDVLSIMYPDRVLLCDRGTVDSSVYWPEGPQNFFAELDTTSEYELNRYDAVVFLETAAAGGIDIEGGNPIRSESIEEAIELDSRLKIAWQQHEHFHFIAHERSFIEKINQALATIQDVIADHAI